MKQNFKHRLLVYTNYVNSAGDGTSTVAKNTETVLDTQKEVGLKVNAEETVNMFLIHELNTR
jgi:hypothetical protein